MNPDTLRFLSPAEIQATLSGISPSAVKDISFIEQGTAAVGQITHTVRSLKGPEHLSCSPAELRALVQKEIIIDHAWLDYQNETGRFFKRTVYLRPPSLRSADALQIMRECDEMSAISVATWLHLREKTDLQNKEHLHFVEPFRALSDRLQLLEAIGRLESHSIESLLDSFDFPRDGTARLVEALSRPSVELLQVYGNNRETPPLLLQGLADRADRPFLFALAPDRHILFPDPVLLITVNNQDLSDETAFAERLYEASLETARALVAQVEPEVEKSALTMDVIDAHFAQHSSLRSDEAWPGIEGFYNSLKRLDELRQTLIQIRAATAQDLSYAGMVSVLNMQLRPVLLTADTIDPPEYLMKSIPDKARIFRHFLDRAKKDPEVLVHQSTRGEFFFIFRSNFVQAFIDHKDQRTLLHLMAKENGFPGGIYDFVAQVKTASEATRRLQEDLGLAIRRWEEDRRKELLKQERARRSIFRRIAEWFLGLFGIKTQTPPGAKSEEPKGDAPPPVPRAKRPQAPAERRKTVPLRVEEALVELESKTGGLIWVDDLADILNSLSLNADALSDILYYDREQRFKEIRPLEKVRRLFIRMDALEDPAWIARTIKDLESKSRLPQHLALLDYLRKGGD